MASVAMVKVEIFKIKAKSPYLTAAGLGKECFSVLTA
jgi:hypothetical protein